MRSPWLLLTLCLSALPALAEEARDTFLPICGDEDPQALDLLQRTQAALQGSDLDEQAELVDRLCNLAAHPVRGNRLIELEEGVWYRGLREQVRVWMAGLAPDVRKRLAQVQDEGARVAIERGERPSDLAVWQRFPLSLRGFEAGRRLLAGAIEQADLPAARRTLAWLQALHPTQDLAALAEQVAWLNEVAPLPTGDGRPGRPPGAVLEAYARIPLDAEAVPAARFSPSYPTMIDERIWVSTGSQVGVYDLEGELQGRIPHFERIISRAPEAATRFTARIHGHGRLAFAPLVLERWVARARVGSSRDGRQDAAFSGRYYSLLAFDPDRTRILWWDGDPGPNGFGEDGGERGVPPGWELADPELLEVLLRSHALASIADRNRVYVALAVKSDEPELRLFAFERGVSDRQALVLRPAWQRTTYLLSAERPGGGGEDEAVYPEVAAALALDPDGRLICTTNVGVVSAVEAETGSMLWTRRAPPAPSRALGFHSRADQDASALSLDPPPYPAQRAETESGPLSVFFAGTQLLAVDPQDGSERWRTHNQGTSRLLLKDQLVLSYGDHRVVAFDAADGRLKRVQPLNTERASGEAVDLGDAILFPFQAAQPRKGPFGNTSLRQLRLIVASNGQVVFQLGGRWELVNERGAANATAIPGGVAVCSRTQLHLLRWKAR